MDRRSLVKAIIAVVSVGVIAKIPRKKVGRVNVDENSDLARRCRVWVDGFEVSDSCYEADDELGYAMIYIKGRDGRMLVRPDGRDLARKKLVGNVLIEVKERSA